MVPLLSRSVCKLLPRWQRPFVILPFLFARLPVECERILVIVGYLLKVCWWMAALQDLPPWLGSGSRSCGPGR